MATLASKSDAPYETITTFAPSSSMMRNRPVYVTTGKPSLPLPQEVEATPDTLSLFLPAPTCKRYIENSEVMGLSAVKATINNKLTLIRQIAQYSARVLRFGFDNSDDIPLPQGPMYMVKYTHTGQHHHSIDVYGNCILKTTIKFVIHDGPDKVPDVISVPLPQEVRAIQAALSTKLVSLISDEIVSEVSSCDLPAIKQAVNEMFAQIRLLGKSSERVERIGAPSCLTMGLTDSDCIYNAKHTSNGKDHHAIYVYVGPALHAEVEFVFVRPREPMEPPAPSYGKAATERNYRNPSECSRLDENHPDFVVPYSMRNVSRFVDRYDAQQRAAAAAAAVATAYPSHDSRVETHYHGGPRLKEAHMHLSQNPDNVSVPPPHEVSVTQSTRTPILAPPEGEPHTEQVGPCNLPKIKNAINKIFEKIRLLGLHCERIERVGAPTCMHMNLCEAGSLYTLTHMYIGETHHMITVCEYKRKIAEVDMVLYGSRAAPSAVQPEEERAAVAADTLLQ
jgi:hypothetical protein